METGRGRYESSEEETLSYILNIVSDFTKVVPGSSTAWAKAWREEATCPPGGNREQLCLL